jgi:hypothetical protein
MHYTDEQMKAKVDALLKPLTGRVSIQDVVIEGK